MLRYGLVLVYNTSIAIYGVLSPKLSDSSVICLIYGTVSLHPRVNYVVDPSCCALFLFIVLILRLLP